MIYQLRLRQPFSFWFRWQSPAATPKTKPHLRIKWLFYVRQRAATVLWLIYPNLSFHRMPKDNPFRAKWLDCSNCNRGWSFFLCLNILKEIIIIIYLFHHTKEMQYNSYFLNYLINWYGRSLYKVRKPYHQAPTGHSNQRLMSVYQLANR